MLVIAKGVSRVVVGTGELGSGIPDDLLRSNARQRFGELQRQVDGGTAWEGTLRPAIARDHAGFTKCDLVTGALSLSRSYNLVVTGLQHPSFALSH